MKYADVSRCEGGHIKHFYEGKRVPYWRFGQCDTCDVVTLPFVTRRLSVIWWWGRTRYTVRRLYIDLMWWLYERTEVSHDLIAAHYERLVGIKHDTVVQLPEDDGE